VRIPNSLKISLLGADGETGEATIDSKGIVVPIIAPDNGRIDKFLINSRRFIF
jgi:hypothetical protein